MKLGQYLDIDELKEALEGRWIVLRRHPTLPMAILNYTNECMFKDYWPEVVQKCRGLIIDAVEGHHPCPDCEILSRPFHKFFNLNHPSQPDYHEINLPKVVPTITEKMDGWFGIMWKCISPDNENGDTHYGIASRGSFSSPGADFATQKLQKLVKYGAVDEFPIGYTAIFEIIFKEGKVVVDYPFEGLVLLALVNNETSEELPYDELFQIWAKILTYSADGRPWIRLVKAHHMTLAECVSYENLVRPGAIRNTDPTKGKIGSVKNMEGFVLSYPRQGTYPIKVKVKLEEYKRLHRIITGITPQQLWRALSDPMEPWLVSEVPDHFRKWSTNWRDKLYSDFHNHFSVAFKVANSPEIATLQATSNCGRKEVFEELKRINVDYANIAMSILDGNIYVTHQATWSKVRPVGREEAFYREGQGE